MISVIIPTIWKVEFSNEIEKIHNLDIVGELIIINNDRKNTPLWFTDISLPKMIEVKPYKNIYCNPAWNMGIKLAKFENSVLFSDDVVIDSYSCLNAIDELLQNKDCLIGCAENCYKVETTDQVRFIQETGLRPYSYGCVMAMRTKSYKPIPENYKIWYGDNILFDLFKNKRDGSYSMDGVGMKNTKIGVSSTCHLDVCHQDDALPYNDILDQYLNG